MRCTSPCCLLALLLVAFLWPTKVMAENKRVDNDHGKSERVLVVGNAAGWVVAGLRKGGRDTAQIVRSLRRYRRRGRVRWGALTRHKRARWVIEAYRRGRGRHKRAWLVLRDASGRRQASVTLRRATAGRVQAWVRHQLDPAPLSVASAPTSRAVDLQKPAWALTSESSSDATSPVAKAHAPPASAAAAGEQLEIDALVAGELESGPVFAAGKPAGSSTEAHISSDAPRFPFTLSGAVWAEHMSYLLDREPTTINSRNEVALDMVLSTRVGSATKFAHAVINGLVRADMSDDARTEAFFKEAYVRAGWGPLTVLAGKRLLSWGVTDAFNPTNTLRRTDLRDPLQPQDRGLFLVQAKLLLGGAFFAEAVWAPLFEDPLQPAPTGIDSDTGLLLSTSRWFSGPKQALVFIPAPALADGPETFQYAGRLGLSAEALDVSLSYTYGYLPVSEFALVAPGVMQGAHHRRHLIGVDFQTTFGRVALKGEAAASLTADLDGSDDQVPDSFLSYVVQLEFSSIRLGRTGHELRLQAQFYAEHGLRGERLQQGLQHPFQFLAIAYAEWKYLDHTGFVLSALFDLPKGLGVRAELWHELVDGLRVELAGLYLDGNSESFFGVFRHNHRVLGRLKYAF
ncbi:MAG: hypothetical protein JRH20_00450 [Deltaproteobacteria bacterium]|nr:hypothetical protein [Deltaproteobacteria bacterium]